MGDQERRAEHGQVRQHAEQPDPDRERQILIVEDPVLLLVVASIAASKKRMGGEVGCDRLVVVRAVLGCVHSPEGIRGELVDDVADRTGAARWTIATNAIPNGASLSIARGR